MDSYDLDAAAALLDAETPQMDLRNVPLTPLFGAMPGNPPPLSAAAPPFPPLCPPYPQHHPLTGQNINGALHLAYDSEITLPQRGIAKGKVNSNHLAGSMWQAIWAVTRQCRPDIIQVLKDKPPTKVNYPSAPVNQLAALNVIAAPTSKIRIEDVKSLVDEGCRWVNLLGMPLHFSSPSGLLLQTQDPMATTTIDLRNNRETNKKKKRQ